MLEWNLVPGTDWTTSQSIAKQFKFTQILRFALSDGDPLYIVGSYFFQFNIISFLIYWFAEKMTTVYTYRKWPI